MLFNDYIDGFQIYENCLSLEHQRILLDACRRVIKENPLWTPKFVGKGFISEFALQNTNCGKYGWLGDESGFRYQERDQNGKPWQPIPPEILLVVKEFVNEDYRAENCLINFYSGKKSHLGLHQDRTERNRTAPIVSISIGQTCVFQIGGLSRDDAVKEVNLRSGDVVVMAGGLNGARNAFHGVKCLIPNTTPKQLGMKTEGRINITVRQVN
jgi:alkylated DNA repair protein (DNA oxidative demethylase)